MITEEQESQLRKLVEIFLEANKKINLSAMRDEESIWIGSVLDSLALLDSQLSIVHCQLLDIGTGGGFPLLPLAICKPDCTCTGLDSTQKKLDAVTTMISTLGLSNASVLCGRTEQLGHDSNHREQYDIVTARAVAELNVLLEFCIPFVKVGGHLVAWKSMKIETELRESLLACAELGCHLVDRYEYDLPEGWGERQLLIFKKTSKTDTKYPRETGVPKKHPLV